MTKNWGAALVPPLLISRETTVSRVGRPFAQRQEGI